ncbi:hypothetical protein C8R43DRAFT_1121727 [Mycena crocata]|nr:hypothetical protein C8R43DRAFT_1121727 [Mycena crocata]
MAKIASSTKNRKKCRPKASNDSRTFRPGWATSKPSQSLLTSLVPGLKTLKRHADIVKHSQSITLGRVFLWTLTPDYTITYLQELKRSDPSPRTGSKQTVHAISLEETSFTKKFHRALDRQKKRRWDPPKKAGTPAELVSPPGSNYDSGNSVDMHQFQDPRADSGYTTGEDALPGSSDQNAALGTIASPTSDECLVLDALAQLAEGVGRTPLGSQKEAPGNNWGPHSIDSSIIRKADQLSSHSSDAHSPYRPAVSLAYGQGPAKGDLPSRQSVALQTTGDIGPLSMVQTAQILVAELNSGGLTPATPDDARKWGISGPLTINRCAHVFLTRKEVSISRWRMTVYTAVQRARQEGVVADDGGDDEISSSWYVLWCSQKGIAANGAR